MASLGGGEAEGEVEGRGSEAGWDYAEAAREAAKLVVREATGRTISLSLGAAAVTYGLAIGTAFSILYFGAWTSGLLRHVLDTMTSLSPVVLLLLIFAARESAGSFYFIYLSLAIYPLTCRALLGRVSEASGEFRFGEAKVLGHSLAGVFRHYAWPRFLPLTLPYFFLGFIQSLAVESMFSSLGLVRLEGGQTWGGLIHQGLEHLLDQPWIVFYAGIAIIVTTLAAYLCVPLIDRMFTVERKN